MSSISFQLILDAALANYSKQIGIDLVNHPLTDNFRSCGFPDDVLKLLEDKNFKTEIAKQLNWLSPVVHVVDTLSARPLPWFHSDQQKGDLLALMFLSHQWLQRLRIYTDLPLTPSMTKKIMVELLSVLFPCYQNRLSIADSKKFAKKLLGENEIAAVLNRLDRLAQQEGRTTVGQTLEVVHGFVNNVRVVMNGKLHDNDKRHHPGPQGDDHNAH